METANFGTFLREERERRQVSLAAISQTTKLSLTSLKLMEAGRLEDLPPDVFVRGFIRSYAKSLGIPSSEPLGLLDQVLAERRRATDPPAVLAPKPRQRPSLASPDRPLSSEMSGEDEVQTPRRGIGLAVFVIIVLLIATITLSLFLRQQPQSGEGLSLEDGVSSFSPPAASQRS
jgi:cytoskeletal protein RodZ